MCYVCYEVGKMFNVQQLQKSKDISAMQIFLRAAHSPKQTAAGTFSGLAEIKQIYTHTHRYTHVYISCMMT